MGSVFPPADPTLQQGNYGSGVMVSDAGRSWGLGAPRMGLTGGSQVDGVYTHNGGGYVQGAGDGYGHGGGQGHVQAGAHAFRSGKYSIAEEMYTLAYLHHHKKLTDEEFQRAKARALGSGVA